MKKDILSEKVIICFHCGNETLMKEVASYKNHVDDEENLIWEKTKWSIYLCPVCNDITLEREYICSEDDYYVGNQCYLNEHIDILYPTININTLNSYIPDKVKKAFEAALKTKKIDKNICAISLRRTLEIICKDKGQNTGPLYTKLKNLSDDGVIPPILDQMAKVLKNIGNEAAHGDDVEIEEETLETIINFSKVIIDYLYILPQKLKEVQEQKRSKNPEHF